VRRCPAASAAFRILIRQATENADKDQKAKNSEDNNGSTGPRFSPQCGQMTASLLMFFPHFLQGRGAIVLFPGLTHEDLGEA
jgi:hypothetical protein